MQMIARQRFTSMSDEQLLSEVRTLTSRERQATAALIASLAELDARQLHLAQGCQSLFAYCTQRLHFTEHEAYDRMKVARAVRQWPHLLDLLADGSLTVTAARLLAPHLTAENHERVLRAATHKRVRQVEEQIAALRPQADVPTTMRKLPHSRRMDHVSQPTGDLLTPGDSGVSRETTAMEAPGSRFESAAAASRAADRPVLSPLAPERFRIQFTIGRETRDTLRRVQDLMRHTLPNGDPAVVFDRALTVLLADLEKKRLAQVQRPRQSRTSDSCSRYISSSIRREVWARDAGQCAFIGTDGRCAATGFLEFHHVTPYAEGGLTAASNLELRCRAHNRYEAARHFGFDRVREDAASYDALAPWNIASSPYRDGQQPPRDIVTSMSGSVLGEHARHHASSAE
jgi:hypothetical protein